MKQTLNECSRQDEMTAGTVGVAENVKVLGWESTNRRRYVREAAQAALPLYEGAWVNIDHPTDENEPVSALRRFGRLKGVEVRESGIYARQLTYNPKHPFAETFAYWVANDPSAVGLSHNAVGEGEMKDGIFVVNKINAVDSVDIVADPATTKGLHEGQMNETPDEAKPSPTDDQAVGSAGWKSMIGDTCAAIVTDTSMDTAAKIAKIKALLKLQDDKPKEEPKPDAPKEEPKESKQPIGHASAFKLFAEHAVPLANVSHDFLEAVSMLPADAATKLVLDRKSIATHTPAQSLASGAGTQTLESKVPTPAEIASQLRV